MDTSLYYAGIRDKREALTRKRPSGFCLVMSVNNLEKNSKAGNVCEVSVQDAARLLTDGTHQLANDEEINAFRDQQAVERARIRKDDLGRTRQMFERAMGRS